VRFGAHVARNIGKRTYFWTAAFELHCKSPAKLSGEYAGCMQVTDDMILEIPPNSHEAVDGSSLRQQLMI
jgi:hypothetical protein